MIAGAPKKCINAPTKTTLAIFPGNECLAIFNPTLAHPRGKHHKGLTETTNRCIFPFLFQQGERIMKSLVTIIAFFTAASLANTAQAIAQRKQVNEFTTVTYQVSTTRQIQQDEIQASLRIEKIDVKSEDVQAHINNDIKTALDLSKKYPDVKTSTGRYFVYKDEQKSQWRGSQTILLDSFTANAIAQYAGELQKNGFVVDNYSYTLSEKSRRSMDDNMRIELLQKASQIATTVIAKGLNKKFIRFSQIDFNSQNYYPVLSLRSFSSANASTTATNPTAQAGMSDVQMTANVSALFEE